MKIQSKPKVVTLCGSTRFGTAFEQANLSETLEGNIVLSIGCNMKSDTDLFGHLSESELDELKNGLDELHKRKIDLSDEVLVLNVGGYIGESTRSEIDYAKARGLSIRYLEPGKRPVQELYNELLYAVERAHPGESRHETALRYIRETENRDQFGGPVCECEEESFETAIARSSDPIRDAILTEIRECCGGNCHCDAK